MVGRLRDDDAIDQHAGHDDLAWMKRTAGGDALDLRDQNPLEFLAAIASARLSSVSASRSIVMLPARSGCRPANQRHGDRERLVEKPLFVVDFIRRTRSSLVQALILPP